MFCSESEGFSRRVKNEWKGFPRRVNSERFEGVMRKIETQV